MSKTSTRPERHALSGPTMGTNWTAQFHANAVDPALISAALQGEVDLVDQQMSTWKSDSDLMQINRAPVGKWLPVSPELMAVLACGLEIGRLSGGAFDIGMGDAVTAWGFGAKEADTQAMRSALRQVRLPAHEVLEIDPGASRLRKTAEIAIDLSGIAKGYGVDRMMDALRRFGIRDALVGIDGDMRALGQRPDGRTWMVAVERPDPDLRAPLSMLEMSDCAVATSGDYRHWVDLGTQRLSHIMDPRRGGPLTKSPASVTVLAETSMEADAWATALMVQGSEAGARTARARNLNALFIERDAGRLRQTPVGPLFGAGRDIGRHS